MTQKISIKETGLLTIIILVISLTIIYVFELNPNLIIAHVFVIIPANFRVKKEDSLLCRLFVAYGFNIVAEKPLQKSMTKRFELVTKNGTKNILKNLEEEETYPILKTKVDFEGQALLHMERDFSKISIENNSFKKYLNSENIQNIVIDETKKEQTERYARFIKCLIQGDESNGNYLFDKVVGYTHEIVLLTNPYELQKNEWLYAKVLYKGEPLKNKIITARNRYKGESATYQYSKTDEEGICSFKIERLGEWFIESTYMIPLAKEEEMDWESYWACYSFGI